MRRVIAVAVLLVGCGILPVHAQTISLAFKQGEQFKYALHFTGTFSAHIGSLAQDVKIDAKAKETVATTARPQSAHLRRLPCSSARRSARYESALVKRKSEYIRP